ncbi:NAD(+)--rifampin ADP-ribosyltransferase [Sphingopyxis sp. H115]|uniref:NAD(+)--rifampin ADP-ribosyltransferase n=1 Tax=Sphingopyxis sp. H115 TaxID=1759073 RepID=UPI00073725E5|nr:NAD(+)--rifampin ADP-ribosyltransferase [Sphingopyxis sp. H115]KTE05647.1 rifampin ADP-ribosyl transferase [Sphingopyxis sp. H115]
MVDTPPAAGPTGPDAGATFYHGTRADLGVGDLLAAGRNSNYSADKPLSWIYFSAALESAIWGCELAAGDGRERIYIVEPTGDWFDDPNLTDQKFRGNPTRSYRSRAPLRIVGEVESWPPHAPEVLQAMKDGLAKLKAEGKDVIID